MKSRRKWIVRLTGLGLLAVVVLAAVRWESLYEAWIGWRLRDEPEFLLTLIDDDGEAWDVERLERILGRERAHRLMSSLFFGLLRDEYPEGWKIFIFHLRGVASPGTFVQSVSIRLSDGEVLSVGGLANRSKWVPALPKSRFGDFTHWWSSLERRADSNPKKFLDFHRSGVLEVDGVRSLHARASAHEKDAFSGPTSFVSIYVNVPEFEEKCQACSKF